MKTLSQATERRERIEMSSSILFMFTYVLLLLLFYAGMYDGTIGAESGKGIPTVCIQYDKTQELIVIFVVEYLTPF